MFGINWWQKIAKALITSLITGVMVLSLVSCADSPSSLRAATQTPRSTSLSQKSSGNISEVSPPEVIQQLRQALEVYQPQVAILSPPPDEVIQDNAVQLRFQVQDLPIFKDVNLDMGPHLHVILDNQPYIAIYDLDQPLSLTDLEPGSHTIRVFASRPWHESFKNEGAYAQTTFHIFTKTQDNNLDSAQPLLTYSRPKGSYGAEPILLDFYLTNAPLHLVAQENTKDNITDWRIRCTINGSSFVLDRWQPVYLKGFKPGKNWVQLELLDEQGNSIKNVFNNTVRLITYEPKGKDTLSKLVRGEISASVARGIVEPNYTANTPVELPPSTSSPSPATTSTPNPTSIQTTPEQPGEVKLDVETTRKTEFKNLEKQKTGGFFSRRRPPAIIPSPNLPTLPEVIERPSPESITPDVTSQPENTPPPATSPQEPAPEVETAPTVEQNPKQLENQKSGGFFNRFRRPSTTPLKLPPTLPELVNPPSSVLPPEGTPQIDSDAKPFVSPAPSPEPSNSEEEKLTIETNGTNLKPDAPTP